MRDEIKEIRIPLWVESPRGDDRFGTSPTGAIISDHDAQVQGTPFQPDVPIDKIQQAVETQLKNDKWVCIQNKDGSTELLTKKDLPKLYPAKEPEPVKETATEPKSDDWKQAFNVNPPKPKPEPAKTEPKEKPPEKSCTQIPCASKPKSPKEVWESKFKSITSATATHKGKGG